MCRLNAICMHRNFFLLLSNLFCQRYLAVRSFFLSVSLFGWFLMIIAVVVALVSVAADGVVAPVVQQIWDAGWFRVQHNTFGHSFDWAIIVANPAAVADVEHVRNVMSFTRFLSIVINHCEELVLLLLLLIFILWRHNFCKENRRKKVLIKLQSLPSSITYFGQFSVQLGIRQFWGSSYSSPSWSQSTLNEELIQREALPKSLAAMPPPPGWCDCRWRLPADRDRLKSPTLPSPTTLSVNVKFFFFNKFEIAELRSSALTSMTSLRVKNGSILSDEWSPSRWTRKRILPPKISLIGDRPKSVVRVMVLLLRVPLITLNTNGNV